MRGRTITVTSKILIGKTRTTEELNERSPERSEATPRGSLGVSLRRGVPFERGSKVWWGG